MQPVIRRALLTTFLISAPLLAAAQVYVDESATGANDGTSWSNAYTALQDALDDPRASSAEIWVASGTYLPTRLRDPIDPRSASFIVSNGDIRIFGGFTGAETSREQRNPKESKTVLSGDIDRDDVTDADGVTPGIDEQRGNNAYRVLFLNGTISSGKPITSNTILDGIVVSAGNANSSTGDETTGGIHCESSGQGSECSPQLVNVVFRGNFGYNGGAFHATTDEGGASEIEFSNVQFIENAGKIGGALSIGCRQSENCNVAIKASEFISNDADCCGGGIGGAISISSASSGSIPGAQSLLTISDSTFKFNRAGSGGAVYFYGGGESSQSEMTVSRSKFLSNFASSGGALALSTYQTETRVLLEDVDFIENSAVRYGGAIYDGARWGGESRTFHNRVVFMDNSAEFEHAESRGGAVYIMATDSSKAQSRFMNAIFYGNTADLGGAVCSHGFDDGLSRPLIVNSTFALNHADYGGALFTDGFDNGEARPAVLNSILWDNSALSGGNEVFNRDGHPTFAFSIVKGSNGSSGWNNNLGVDGGNNIDQDPDFVDLLTSSNSSTTKPDLSINSDSPAVDHGNTDSILSDLDHGRGVRVIGPAVDAGAFEWGSIFSDSF